MNKRFKYLIIPLITLILEIIPYGAVCNFARPATDGSIGYFRELYSYFDLLPFGYANFSPLITALLTCIIILLLVVYCFTGKHVLANIAKKFLYFTIAISLYPLLLGFRFFSIVGTLITASLIAQALLIRLTIKPSNN